MDSMSMGEGLVKLNLCSRTSERSSDRPRTVFRWIWTTNVRRGSNSKINWSNLKMNIVASRSFFPRVISKSIIFFIKIKICPLKTIDSRTNLVGSRNFMEERFNNWKPSCSWRPKTLKTPPCNTTRSLINSRRRGRIMWSN